MPSFVPFGVISTHTNDLSVRFPHITSFSAGVHPVISVSPNREESSDASSISLSHISLSAI